MLGWVHVQGKATAVKPQESATASSLGVAEATQREKMQTSQSCPGALTRR